MVTPVSQAQPRPRERGAAADAIALLQADHEAVRQLFADFEGTACTARKKALVQEICAALQVHAQIEAEIFHPEVRTALKAATPLPYATIKQGGVGALIQQLHGVEPYGVMYDAKVSLLAEHVKHHVRDANQDMFPKLQASSLDMLDVGARMAARRQDLLALMASPPSPGVRPCIDGFD